MSVSGHLLVRCRAGSSCFVSGSPGLKFVAELANETLHRPGAGFTEGADRAATRDVIRDANEVFGILRAALA